MVQVGGVQARAMSVPRSYQPLNIIYSFVNEPEPHILLEIQSMNYITSYLILQVLTALTDVIKWLNENNSKSSCGRVDIIIRSAYW